MANSVKLDESLLKLPDIFHKYFSDEIWKKILFESEKSKNTENGLIQQELTDELGG